LSSNGKVKNCHLAVVTWVAGSNSETRGLKGSVFSILRVFIRLEKIMNNSAALFPGDTPVVAVWFAINLLDSLSPASP